MQSLRVAREEAQGAKTVRAWVCEDCEDFFSNELLISVELLRYLSPFGCRSGTGGVRVVCLSTCLVTLLSVLSVLQPSEASRTPVNFLTSRYYRDTALDLPVRADPYCFLTKAFGNFKHESPSAIQAGS
jgi:hypothetical protein